MSPETSCNLQEATTKPSWTEPPAQQPSGRPAKGWPASKNTQVKVAEHVGTATKQAKVIPPSKSQPLCKPGAQIRTRKSFSEFQLSFI